LICGLPGHPVEDVCFCNIRIAYEGGGTKADAAIEPPELERAYPEPSMFGTIPAYGLYARHVKGLTLRDVVVSFEKKDERPAVVLNDVADAFLDHVKAQLSPGVPLLVARDVVGLMVRNCPGAPEV
jgi:hypothetical protein